MILLRVDGWPAGWLAGWPNLKIMLTSAQLGLAELGKNIYLPLKSQTLYVCNLGQNIIKKCTNIYTSEHINVKGCLNKIPHIFFSLYILTFLPDPHKKGYFFCDYTKMFRIKGTK